MPFVEIANYQPIGSHAVLDLTANSGVAQKPTVQAGADGLLIQATGGNARFTLDGQTPTSTLGFQVLDGGLPILVPITNYTTFQVIKEGSAGTLQIQWVVTA